MRLQIAVVAQLVFLLACTHAPGPGPEQIVWEGKTLKKARHGAHRDNVYGVVYATPGQPFEKADTQLGLVFTSDLSPEALHFWIMSQYLEAPVVTRIFEMTGGNNACKIGKQGERTFIATHYCTTQPGLIGLCLEADERSDLEALCITKTMDCLASICESRLERVVPQLEALRKTQFEALRPVSKAGG